MKKPVIAISMGDPAGIGPEITARSLMSKTLRDMCQPIIVGHSLLLKPFLKKPLSYPCIHIELPRNTDIAQGQPHRNAGLFALKTIRTAVALCRAGLADALVTAPVNKYTMQLVDRSFIGHTEFLARLCASKMPIMMMQAEHMRFIMITRHTALMHVNRYLTSEHIINTVSTAWHELTRKYHMKIRKAVICGLNPHAGDNGALGKEEKNIIVPAVQKLKKKGYNLEGPLPADSAIRKMYTKEFDLCFSIYHDQVMIPLKLLYPRLIVNITLGLPFIRTSPGHGTAYEIAGKNVADASSMIHAIKTAVVFFKSGNTHA